MPKKPRKPTTNGKADRLWPAARVTMTPIDLLTPYARNARLHSDAQVDQIAASMREFGFTIPVLTDEDGEIIAGHGRVLAAKRNGYTQVPVMIAAGWTEAQKQAYRIADNQLTINATWDDSLLRIELGELQGVKFDLSLIGFGDDEFARIMGTAGPEPMTPDQANKTLAERFGIAPFSVLNAREGWWQDRKRAWIALGIQSEVGRGENLLAFSDSVKLDGKAYKERFSGRSKKAGSKK